ncbi:Hint domain-containing protein [Paenirhodobacter enshiensis]|uniref:Hint domain-containing protein n=1 Tax=Paenirhodobacter enshiensis TaxID=1105367 RepID=UPI001FDF7F52|nr:Hint domain-containing protein [Paenirhodobacter enshiensis]
MTVITSLYVTSDMLGYTSTEPHNPAGVNSGDAGFEMIVDNATTLSSAKDLTTSYYRLDLWQGSSSASQFDNGQWWSIYAYTGTGDPTTDTDPSHWSTVYSQIGVRDDLVSGLGRGDDYVVLKPEGGDTGYVVLDLTSPFTSTPTTQTYTPAQNPAPGGDDAPTFTETRNAYENALTCFTRGTLIATVRGEVAIEDLTEGDLVLTSDHGPQPLRWIGSVVVSARRLERVDKLRPIRISAGALGTAPDGTALPRTDLTVSPQHRILVRSHIAERMFGQPEVLVAARQLLQIPGIDTDGAAQPVEYFHLLFDRHEVIVANGAETESLYTGPEALKLISQAARAEILTLFPELATRDYAPSAARVLVSGRQARKLAVRHIQNRKPLVA